MRRAEPQASDPADAYLPVDEMGIPYRGLKDVSGTSFDFRNAKSIAGFPER